MVKATKKQQINGCALQSVSIIGLLVLFVGMMFGGAHGGISSGKGVSMGPNNRPAEKSGCAIFIVPLFGLVGFVAVLMGNVKL